MTWFYYVVVAGFGLIFGSFFNVCVYRMPLGKPLNNRSACPSCGTMIHWYDNIPVVSFVVLKGKCRGCGSPISWRYPMVELSTALLFVLIYWWSISIVPGEIGVSGGDAFVPELVIGLLMVSVLIISVGADVSHGIVPNEATFPGMVLMLVAVVGLSVYRGEPWRIGTAVASAAIGAGFLFFAGTLYGMLFMKRGEDREDDAPEKTRDANGGGQVEGDDDEEEDEFRTGIGMGDVKLMIVIGLALGYFKWYLVVIQLFLGYLVGAVVAITLMMFIGLGRKDRLPFVPFLAAGAIITLIWGQVLVDWYLKLLT